MLPDKENQDEMKNTVDIGNASNAGPNDSTLEPAGNENQLLDKNAEKYLRQVTSPEEMPDREESQDLDEQEGNGGV